MTLPLVRLEGSPFDQGLQHGRALASSVAHNVETYFDRFEREVQLAPDEARERAQRFVPVLREHEYYEAMRGVADGAGVPLRDIVVLNMRYELLYFQYGQHALIDGCTSFALLPTVSENGHLLLGQNWDWIPEVHGAVLHVREPDDLEILSFTEAGIVGGKIGLNSVGLGLAINGLYSASDDWSRPAKPFHVRCYDILRARRLSDAVAVIAGGQRACSTNFLVAQAPAAACDVEAAPNSIRTIDPIGATLVHSNHFEDPARLGVEEPTVERRPHSYHRERRMRDLLDARTPLEVSLSDHHDFPDGICRHVHPDDPPAEAVITVTSVIMDLDAYTLRLTDGQPCAHPYEHHTLAHTAVAGRCR